MNWLMLARTWVCTIMRLRASARKRLFEGNFHDEGKWLITIQLFDRRDWH